MTLNDFSNMLFSTDNDAIIRVFERDEDVDQYIAGDRGGLLFPFNPLCNHMYFCEMSTPMPKSKTFTRRLVMKYMSLSY